MNTSLELLEYLQKHIDLINMGKPYKAEFESSFPVDELEEGEDPAIDIVCKDRDSYLSFYGRIWVEDQVFFVYMYTNYNKVYKFLKLTDALETIYTFIHCRNTISSFDKYRDSTKEINKYRTTNV